MIRLLLACSILAGAPVLWADDVPKPKPPATIACPKEGLVREVPEIALDRVSFDAAIDFLREAGELNILVNAPALAEAGIKFGPVTLMFQNLNVAQLLRQTFGHADIPKGKKILYTVDDAVVIISTSDDLALAMSAVRTDHWDKVTRAQLDKVVTELKFDDVPLDDALEVLRDLSGMSISVDWPALEKAGIPRDRPLRLRTRNVPLRQILSFILDYVAAGRNRAGFDVGDGAIVISTIKELPRAVTRPVKGRAGVATRPVKG